METLSELLARFARGYVIDTIGGPTGRTYSRSARAAYEKASAFAKADEDRHEAELAELRLKLAEAKDLACYWEDMQGNAVEHRNELLGKLAKAKLQPPLDEEAVRHAIDAAALWFAEGLTGTPRQDLEYDDTLLLTTQDVALKHYRDMVGQPQELQPPLDEEDARDAPNKAGGLSEEQREELGKWAGEPTGLWDHPEGWQFLAGCLLALADQIDRAKEGD